MKSEDQLARTELEWRALDDAFDTMRYLRFSPKNDTWKSYCDNLGWKISDALTRAEFWAANPDYKFG